MGTDNRANRYSPEVRARAVRMVFEQERHYESRAAAVKAKKLTQAEVADRLGKAVETISNIERGASWTSLEMLENLSGLLGERVGFFFDDYVGSKRKSRSRLQLEAELSEMLRHLTEDQLRVVRDLARSLHGSVKHR